MCGVVAVLRADGRAAEPAHALVAALSHRGPDGHGVWAEPGGRVALGHSRLAVISPEDGKQPFISPDGQTVCVVNGEIYGYREMRAQLEGLGHHFVTGSDCEVVLHAFLQYGERAFGRLRGEWCALIWHGPQRRLLMARDRFGAKTCVYRRSEDGWEVASEAKALFALGGPRRWDHEAWGWVTHLQYLPPDRTLFEGIHMVPPAGLVVVDPAGLRVGTWATGHSTELGRAAFGASPLRTSTGGPEAFRAAFFDAVQTRLVSDAKLCFHLSGGVDSASVLGAATQLAGEGQQAFTVSFVDSELDEVDLAQETARFNRAQLHVIEVRPKDILHELMGAARAGEGLGVNGHLSAHHAMDRAISEMGFKSVLSGEGADELLAGYPHLRQDWAEAQGLVFDDSEDGALRGLMVGEGDSATLPAFERLGFTPAFVRAKAGIGAKLRGWLRGGLALPPPGRLFDEVQVQTARARHPVEVSSALWARWALGGYILPTLSDRMLGAFGLEARLPFLDPHLFDLVHSGPMDLRIRDGVEKWVLREAMRDVVPERIRVRRKHPFVAPCPVLSGGPEARRLAQDMLRPEVFGAPAIFDAAQVSRKIDELSVLPAEHRLPWSPPLMLVLSAHALGVAYGIEG